MPLSWHSTWERAEKGSLVTGSGHYVPGGGKQGSQARMHMGGKTPGSLGEHSGVMVGQAWCHRNLPSHHVGK